MHNCYKEVKHLPSWHNFPNNLVLIFISLKMWEFSELLIHTEKNHQELMSEMYNVISVFKKS